MRNPFESERKIFSKIKNPTREKIPALHQTNSTGEASKTSSKQNLIQDEASRKKNQIESYQMADINFSAHSGFRGHFEAKVSENKIIEESKALQMRYEVSQVSSEVRSESSTSTLIPPQKTQQVIEHESIPQYNMKKKQRNTVEGVKENIDLLLSQSENRRQLCEMLGIAVKQPKNSCSQSIYQYESNLESDKFVPFDSQSQKYEYDFEKQDDDWLKADDSGQVQVLQYQKKQQKAWVIDLETVIDQQLKSMYQSEKMRHFLTNTERISVSKYFLQFI